MMDLDLAADGSQDVIRATGVSKMFHGQSVLDGIDLTVKSGKVHGLVGSNGAGKTTLLRILNGVYQPTQGEVWAFGERMQGDSAALRQRIHLVNADGPFYPEFRVQDLLRYASMLYERWDVVRAKDLIDTLELPLRAPIRTLSLGMRMQLRLAVALASRPDVMLLDEPTNGLDPVVRRQFLGLIVQEVAGTGMSVVLATHRLDEVTAMADDVSVLHNGRQLMSIPLEGAMNTYVEILAVLNVDDAETRTQVEAIRTLPDVMKLEHRGKVVSLIGQGDIDALRHALTNAGAVHVDVQPVPFDSLFRALMEREGYARDAILLS